MSIAQINRMRSSAPSSPDATGVRRKIASASAGIQPIRGRDSETMNAPPRHIHSDEQAYVTLVGSPADIHGSLMLGNRITTCYRQALAGEPIFTGKLSLSLQVNAKGHVARTALLSGADFNGMPIPFSQSFVACVDAAARSLTFEVPKAGALLAVSYNLTIGAAVIFEHDRDWRH